MTYIVAVCPPKPGVGATTIAHALAAAAALHYERVGLLDREHGGDATRWADVAHETGRGLPYAAGFVDTGAMLTRWLNRHADEWDVLIIEGDPRNGAHSRAVMRNAHHIVTPVSAGPADLAALWRWLRHCEQLHKQPVVTLNYVRRATRDVPEAGRQLRERSLLTSRSELASRVAVPRNFGSCPKEPLRAYGEQLLDELVGVAA